MTPFELFIVQNGNYQLKIMRKKKKKKTKKKKEKKKKNRYWKGIIFVVW